MNRRTKIYIIAVIATAIALQLFINNSINREKKMVEEVMSDELSSVNEGSVSAYAYYGNEKLTPELKELMLKRLAEKIGIYSDYTINHKEDGLNETTTLNKLGEYGDTEIRLISMVSTDSSGIPHYENYVLSDLQLHEGSTKKLYNCKKLLLDIYDKLGMEPVTNIYVCSTIKGQLSEEAISKETKDFLSSLDATKVETIKLDNVSCTYGYSKNIDSYAYQNNQKVNVNIAIAYDAENDITTIHKAIPFIDRSF